jgi:hypothetical protein
MGELVFSVQWSVVSVQCSVAVFSVQFSNSFRVIFSSKDAIFETENYIDNLKKNN